MMGEVENMMKDTNDAAQKERLQRMQRRMTAMMANMQKMGNDDGRHDEQRTTARRSRVRNPISTSRASNAAPGCFSRRS
jgi:hypothetical protein